MLETKQFKTESKRLLDLMINSIYTNKEIFLRELISNASDAIDKYHYLSLNDEKLEKRDDYKINIEVDKTKRTISIEDNGIGMTKDELDNNLGTIASSGSLEFLNKLKEENNKENQDSINIIGQFGVGFYSAFMVAKEVIVETRSPYSDTGYRFTSKGEDTYSIEEINKENVGTKITLYLRDNEDEENYDEFLETYRIKGLVKKYSDYVRYPIQMLVTKQVQDKDDSSKTHEETSLETLNSMIPLWKKNKSEVTDEELNRFYKEKFHEYDDPLVSLFNHVEGMISYDSMLFIPKKAPLDLYSEDYERGLQLYSKGVFIMDKCKELIPDYLRFVKGLVDSSDLSLNISREMLQQSRQLKKISVSIEKKVLNELNSLKDNDFDKYSTFFDEFGVNLKYGIYSSYGAKKDELQDLLLYHTIKEDKYQTLREYVAKMQEGQKDIYFASVASKEFALNMPQMEMLKKKNYDVLILTNPIDELTIQMMGTYDTHKFVSIQGDLDLEDEQEKKDTEQKQEENKDLLQAIKDSLKDEVDEVKLSSRLAESPVCLVAGGDISFEMERTMNAMTKGTVPYKAKRILEINPNHELFKALEKVYSENKDDLEEYSSILLDQALLLENMPLKDPLSFSKKITDLMIKASK